MSGTCDYHDDHDHRGEPRGNRCGKPATKSIRWRDGRWSLGCEEHAAEISREVPHLVRSISPREGGWILSEATITREELERIFYEGVEHRIDAEGVNPAPMLVAERGGGLSFCALLSDLTPAQMYGFAWKKILVDECLGLVLGLDRWTKPGQGTEFADALVCLSFWRGDGNVMTAGHRVGVINYRHEPRVVRPWDWENRFWSEAMRSEFSKTCPISLLGARLWESAKRVGAEPDAPAPPPLSGK